ncbi:Hypothetical protein CulFRC58_0473 [Corynebacterium ulcerans FRC58]|uniref:Transposase n=1 Tax=Corynebacterium ulcerans FRC58 TaxID=1408268 RepID=A0ABM5TYS3_CORUL|nr:Hypothetical protein CulFRC58_0473 [Corynebacterium ulcerans FRC58]
MVVATKNPMAIDPMTTTKPFHSVLRRRKQCDHDTDNAGQWNTLFLYI